jgi:hypothetical protein
MGKLTILIVNYNSADFVALSLKALSSLTKNQYTVNILDNGSKLNDFRKLQKHCQIYENVILERCNSKMVGSLDHGTGLNYLVKKVKTEYFVILDADAIFLIKSWDEILLSRLSENKVVIGAQPPPPKPQDFPSVFATLFISDVFKSLNIDFRPSDINKGQDTGWQIREKYLAAGYTGEVLKFFNTRNYKEGPFRKQIVAEYYLDGYKDIFVSHFGRGSTLGKQKYEKIKCFLFYFPYFKELYLKYKGSKEKKEWIFISKMIIESQS